MRFNAILFDFDGTLAPNLDLPDMRRQVIALTEAQGVPPAVFRDQYIVEIIDHSTQWLRQQRGRDVARRYEQTARQKIVDIEISAAQSTRPFVEVAQMLSNFSNNDTKLGVVTRNCRAAVLEVFPNLLDLVDCLVARDDTVHLKPDPRHLSQCLALMGCQPEKAVMVGDGVLDMRAGQQLNMYCVGVLSGSGSAPALRNAGATLVLSKLNATNLFQHLDCDR